MTCSQPRRQLGCEALEAPCFGLEKKEDQMLGLHVLWLCHGVQMVLRWIISLQPTRQWLSSREPQMFASECSPLNHDMGFGWALRMHQWPMSRTSLRAASSSPMWTRSSWKESLPTSASTAGSLTAWSGWWKLPLDPRPLLWTMPWLKLSGSEHYGMRWWIAAVWSQMARALVARLQRWWCGFLMVRVRLNL